MARGFEFELSDGKILQLVPHDGASRSAIAHGETRIDVEVQSGAFEVSAPPGRDRSAVPSVVRFAIKDMTVGQPVQPDASASSDFKIYPCMICNGQSCCVHSGCGNCGCGWICA